MICPSFRNVLALTTATFLIAGCLDDGHREVDPAATPKPVAKHGNLPKLASPVMQADGTLAEKMTMVKLPVAKPGEATTFRFGKENERQAWVATLPERAQLVSLAYEKGKDDKGRIFVGGGFDSSAMYALDAQTGKRQWVSYSLADPGPTAAVVDNDELAFDTYSCSLAVLQASTGKILWQKNIGSETPTQPAFTKDYVIAPHPSDGGFALTAYNRKNGAHVWSAPIDNHGMTAPIVTSDAVYITTTAGSLYKVTLAGKPVWAKHISALSSPWIDGDEVHLAVREKGLEAQIVLSAIDGKKLRTVSTAKFPEDAPGEDTQAVWSYEGSRPVVRDGVRYTAMGDRVEARDAATNELRWERKATTGGGARKVESIVVAGKLALITTRDGKIVGLDTKTGAQRIGYDFGTQVSAQPIVANGWMYVSTAHGQIVAFDLGDSTMDGWHMWGGNAAHNL